MQSVDFDLWLGDVLVGLEAAHIQWHQAGGPDQVSNGLALCSLRHKLFDRDAFTADPDHLDLQVSQDAVGGQRSQGQLHAFHGQRIRLPQGREYDPDPKYLLWHHKEVFREPARGVTT